MKLTVKYYEGMSSTAALGILLHHKVTWYTQTHILYPSTTPLCLSLMLCTVREGKSRRVLEEGGGGEQLRGRESRASTRRRKERGSEQCEPRLQPTRY